MNALATSTTIAYLNKTNCNSVPVPLPPTAEQIEIVRLLDSCFDGLEAALEIQAESSLTVLGQSILAKAFRGDLVPQDPRDEPASVLLERIRATRQANVEGKRKTTRRNRVTINRGK